MPKVGHPRSAAPDLALYLPSLIGGGAERVMANLAVGFAERGLRIHLVLARAHGTFLPLVQDHPNIEIIDLEANRTSSSLFALVRYLRQVQPPCLISALEHANLVALVAKRLSGSPVRVIPTVHNQRSVYVANSSLAKERLLPFLMRLLYPSAHSVVAVSRGVADDLEQSIGVSRSRITTIYNPVVSDQLFSLADEEPQHPWLVPGQPPVVLAIGRLASQKDFTSLIRAFDLVQQQCASRLLILGEGPKRRELEALVGELGLEGKVALPGFVENPYAYLKRCGAFVLSSRWEGLPTVLIEALALGAPIVATDCPSGPKEILENGRYGRLVPVGDESSMAKAILDAFEEPIEFTPSEAIHRFQFPVSLNAYLGLAQVAPAEDHC